MRLSDIKGERSIEVIAELIEPIANIAADKAATDLFKAQKATGKKTAEGFAERVRKNLPALLKTHKDDIIAIMAAINGVSREEYAKEMTLASLLGDAYEVLTDKEFLVFFSSSELIQG